MKLIRMKCPNRDCSKEIYFNIEDVKTKDGDELDFLCPFCLMDHDIKLTPSQLNDMLMLNLEEIEFQDRSELDGVKVRSIVEKLEEVLHEAENLSYGEEENGE